MDDDIAIKVDHVSKKYCKNLKRSIVYGLNDIVRNTMGMSSHSDSLRKDEFWAVNDVSFEVKKGEILGLIGPNGSGKTTLLQMLNGIFWPDKGKITIRGRVGALIAVGAGFHPTLTGRENIYLNGAILGMKKEEIARKYEEIVNFADIGDFLNTPVKNYSSGMFVRLGFAIAAHCNQDILLVDEVLAVGDLKFQSKCMKFLTENVLNVGNTVIFVSHSRYAVQDLCNRALYLKKGQIIKIGNTLDVIQKYLDDIDFEEGGVTKDQKNFLDIDRGIIKIEFFDKQDNLCKQFKSGEMINIKIYFHFEKPVKNPSVAIAFLHNDARYRITSSTDYLVNINSIYDGLKIESLEGSGYFQIEIEKAYLPVGQYVCLSYLYLENRMNLVQKIENAADFEILWPDSSSKRSLFELPHKWDLKIKD